MVNLFHKIQRELNIYVGLRMRSILSGWLNYGVTVCKVCFLQLENPIRYIRAEGAMLKHQWRSLVSFRQALKVGLVHGSRQCILQ